MEVRKIHLYLLALVVTLSLSACQPLRPEFNEVVKAGSHTAEDADKLLIVDCLLPGQIRKLGTSLTYLAPRRPVLTSAEDCEIRGGEYTAYDRADYRTALKVWLDSAKQGDPKAEVHVGEIYEKGLGMEPDYATAAVWYRKAAEQGDTQGAVNLGYLYEKGLGVEKDMLAALNWYRKASGLEGEDLAFASSIEVQTDRLNRKLSESRAEAKALRAHLEKAQRQLQSDQAALNTSERELEELHRARDATNHPAQPDAAKDTQSEAGILSQLEQKIGRQETQIQLQRKRLKQLQAELVNNQAKLDTLEISNTAGVAGPTIDLLDPPVTLTRGSPTVWLRAAAKERIIIGKVKAPAGLSTLSVNDHEMVPDESGIFQAAIPLLVHQTPVHVQVIDRKGLQASLRFRLISSSSRVQSEITSPRVNPPSEDVSIPINFGNYYSLIIGNNNYAKFPQLKTAANDARTVERLLREQYGFKATLLINADRYSILSALNTLRKNLTEKDNLLIYYAGHGELDTANGLGYWLPVDAEPNNPANWISNVDITAILNTISAQHVLVVADSCYSGALTQTSVARLASDLPLDMRMKWFEVMARTRSRTVLTAGGLEPVLDSGGGDHSVFARAFFDALNNHEGILEGYSLYRKVSAAVNRAAAELNVEQTPEYAPIRHAGHEAGEFLFVPVKFQAEAGARQIFALNQAVRPDEARTIP